MSTLRHTIANVVSVPITTIRLLLVKVVYPKNIFFKKIERFSPNVVFDVDKKSKLIFGNHIAIHSGGRLSANSGGELRIGDNTSFNVGCIVVCKKKVTIGNNVSIGPNVMMYDHDHIMGCDRGVKTTPFRSDEIVIGDGSWIGAGCIILSGTNIGKNCVIAAGSIVKGSVPDNTRLIQKRQNTYKI